MNRTSSSPPSSSYSPYKTDTVSLSVLFTQSHMVSTNSHRCFLFLFVSLSLLVSLFWSVSFGLSLFWSVSFGFSLFWSLSLLVSLSLPLLISFWSLVSSSPSSSSPSSPSSPSCSPTPYPTTRNPHSTTSSTPLDALRAETLRAWCSVHVGGLPLPAPSISLPHQESLHW